jgi:hypothetical protein
MEEAAADEDYWAIIQNAFSVTRGMVGLNNGGLSPSLRIVTEALEPAGGRQSIDKRAHRSKNKKNRRASCAPAAFVSDSLSYANPRESSVGWSIDSVVASP